MNTLQGDLLSDLPKPVIDRPLIAYAFLAQATQVSGDLLSGLAPVFKPIARSRVGQRFNPFEFSEVAKKLYGIEIHPWAVDDLAHRLEKAGLLARNKIAKTGEEYFYAEVTEEFDAVGEADIRLVVEKFIEFSRPLIERNKVKINDKVLEDAFFQQLVSMDFHSILLKPEKKEVSGKTLALSSKPENGRQQELAENAKLDVLCASFIVYAYHNEHQLYDLIVRIATGAMLAETVLNFQSPGTSVSLNTLRVVLDAPFLMFLLDLSGEHSTEYSRSLCNKLIEKGASIQVFRHSIEEIESNLRASLAAHAQGNGYGATVRRLGNSAFRHYVESVARDVESVVTQKGFKVIDALQSDDIYRYFTEEDEKQFCTVLGSYENSIARERDAASIAAIMRYRRGKSTRMGQFHQALYLFVTDNARVADRSDSFTVNRRLRAKGDVPPAITDRSLAGMLFVLFGGQAAELTHYRLLANCTAALEPRSDVMAKIHSFLKQLDEEKANHFRSLMTDQRASQHMMQLTLGDSILVTSAHDAEDILERVEQKIGEKLRVEYEEKLSDKEKAHTEEVDALVLRHSQLSEEVRASRAEALGVRDQLQTLQGQTTELRQTLFAQENRRKEEVRCLIESCVNHAKQAVDFAHHMISLAILIATLLVAWLGTSMVPESWTLAPIFGLGFAGILAIVGFYKNPEKLFGKWLKTVRQNSFQKKALEYRVLAELSAFEVDWPSGQVKPIYQAVVLEGRGE
jgi:hypothetical protein